MKKKCLLFTGIVFIFLLLTACSEDVIQYEAKPSDFGGGGFSNKSGQRIMVNDGELVIISNLFNRDKMVITNNQAKETSIDKLFKYDDYPMSEPLEKVYKDFKITTKGDRYYITIEGMKLEFKKIGQRIIVDEEGVEYFTSKYPE